MMNLKRFFDRRLLRFLLVGVLNTLVGAGLMFLFYNAAGMGYWGSSAVSYVLASVLSFVLNRRFTFESRVPLPGAALRFALNVGICYVIAYSAAKPLLLRLLSNTQLSPDTVEQAAMLFGMALFTLLNYVGQRFVVFSKKQP